MNFKLTEKTKKELTFLKREIINNDNIKIRVKSYKKIMFISKKALKKKKGKKPIIPKWKQKLKIVYRIGNKKLGNDTIIINVGSALLCYSGLKGYCPLYKNRKCYALRDEIQYFPSLPFKEKQRQSWNQLTDRKIVKDILLINRHLKTKIKYLRLNESGDIKNNEDLKKLNSIAELLKKHKIKVYTYTHNYKLNFKNLSSNLSINSSIKNKNLYSNNNRFLSYAESFINRVNTIKQDRKIVNCPADCSQCNYCKASNNLTILCQLH